MTYFAISLDSTMYVIFSHVRAIGSIYIRYIFGIRSHLPHGVLVLYTGYCSQFQNGISRGDLHKLQIAQNSLARPKARTPKYQQVTPVLTSYTGCSLPRRP